MQHLGEEKRRGLTYLYHNTSQRPSLAKICTLESHACFRSIVHVVCVVSPAAFPFLFFFFLCPLPENDVVREKKELLP